MNHDTSAGVSKNIVLVEKSKVDKAEKASIEWIGIKYIQVHTDSVEDKDVFANCSCIASLNFWTAYYNEKVDFTPKVDVDRKD